MIDLLADGKYNLLPSFFRMINALKKAKREFAVIFRTFGDDLLPIVRELNAFCAGEHPCFNGKYNTPIVKFDGSKNNKNFKIKSSHLGFIDWKANDIEECQLTMGSVDRKEKQGVRKLKGPHAVHAFMGELLKEVSTNSTERQIV